MNKPLHWNNIEDENRAILSAVALLKIDLVMMKFDLNLNKDELDSLLWGYWDENKKELRPYIYQWFRMGNKMIKKIVEETSQK